MSATITKLRASDPLSQQQRIALATLSFLAEAAERAGEAADTLDLLPPYLRAEFRQMRVAVSASAESLTNRIGKLKP